MRTIIGVGTVAACAVAGAVALSGVATATPLAAQQLSGTKGYCARNGDGAIHHLWLTTGGECQAGFNGPLALGGTTATVTATATTTVTRTPSRITQPGDAATYRKSQTVTLNSSNTPRVVTFTGVPRGGLISFTTNASAAPSGTSVTVVERSHSAASTERVFDVTSTGLVDEYNLTITVTSSARASR
jgi:hypothetical protein